jgi:hypothetical protein
MDRRRVADTTNPPLASAPNPSAGTANSGALIEDVQRFIPDLQRWELEHTVAAIEPLPFYRDYQLLRLTEGGQAGRTLSGLYAPGDFWPLDWNTKSIYHVNKIAPLQLSSETVRPYVLFLLTSLLGSTEQTPDVAFEPLPSGAGFHVAVGGSSFNINPGGEIEVGVPPSELLKRIGKRNPRTRRVRAISGVKRWKLITLQEKRQVLGDLEALAVPEQKLWIRRADISFYKTHAIYELLVESGTEFKQAYVLHRPGFVTSLDRQSLSLRHANQEEAPRLDADVNVIEYLRFFCWALSAENGRFLLVEKLRDIPWCEAPPDDKREKILNSLKPIQLLNRPGEADAGDKWILSAVVCYGDTLFTAWFSVRADGSVAMGDDEEIVGGLPLIYGTASEPHISILENIEGPQLSREPKTYLDRHVKDAERESCGADQMLAALLQGKDA